MLDHIMSKWGVLVLLALTDGTHRWGELRREVDGISEKMLASTLRTLEADGLVDRTSYPEVPPRVEYSLTPRARADGADAAARRVGGGERGAGDPGRADVRPGLALQKKKKKKKKKGKGRSCGRPRL